MGYSTSEFRGKSITRKCDYCKIEYIINPVSVKFHQSRKCKRSKFVKKK